MRARDGGGGGNGIEWSRNKNRMDIVFIYYNYMTVLNFEFGASLLS